MALRAVTESPKFARLKRALGLPRWQTLGLLESIWHFTSKQTPDGNIGRWNAEDIAAWIEWDGDAQAMMDALVKTGWIDAGETEKTDARGKKIPGQPYLRVHDWAQHADDAIQMQLARLTQLFAGGSIPKLNRFGDNDRRAIIKKYDAKYGAECVDALLAERGIKRPGTGKNKGKNAAASERSTAPSTPCALRAHYPEEMNGNEPPDESPGNRTKERPSPRRRTAPKKATRPPRGAAKKKPGAPAAPAEPGMRKRGAAPALPGRVVLEEIPAGGGAGAVSGAGPEPMGIVAIEEAERREGADPGGSPEGDRDVGPVLRNPWWPWLAARLEERLGRGAGWSIGFDEELDQASVEVAMEADRSILEGSGLARLIEIKLAAWKVGFAGVRVRGAEELPNGTAEDPEPERSATEITESAEAFYGPGVASGDGDRMLSQIEEVAL